MHSCAQYRIHYYRFVNTTRIGVYIFLEMLDILLRSSLVSVCTNIDVLNILISVPLCLFTCRRSRGFILLLTFVIYTCYHASRKPLSVVKSVLHPNCSELTPPANVSANDTNWCAWKPFGKSSQRGPDRPSRFQENTISSLSSHSPQLQLTSRR